MENLQLLRVPDVVQSHLLSFLTISEQLCLRGVCKVLKGWVDRDSARLAKHIPCTILKDRGKISFSCLVFGKSRVPHRIRKIDIECVTLEMYEDVRGMTEFLRRYSQTITDLRLRRLYICAPSSKQNTFLSSLSNLKSLEVDEAWLANADFTQGAFPEVLNNLKTLKMTKLILYNEDTMEVVERVGEIPSNRRNILRIYFWNFVESCKQLDHIRLPSSHRLFYDTPFEECFKLLNFARQRATEGYRELRNPTRHHLIQVDLINFANHASSTEVLLVLGARMRVQFLNVNTKILKRSTVFSLVDITRGGKRDYIHSFESSCLVTKTFNFIQKITIKASLIQNECIIGRNKGPTVFPNLREMCLTVDIGFDMTQHDALYSVELIRIGNHNHRNICFPRADQVFKFFFPETGRYRYIHTLSITFTEPVFPNQKRAGPEQMNTLTPLAKCMPNVNKLIIKGWNSANRETYLKMWNGLLKLQKLVIDSCSSLNASCFIGGNGNTKDLLNYKNLTNIEYVELRGLGSMPGMSTRVGLGKKVFNRMGLVPFQFLTHDEQEVWVRNIVEMDIPRLEGRVTTRSMTKSVKRKKSGGSRLLERRIQPKRTRRS